MFHCLKRKLSGTCVHSARGTTLPPSFPRASVSASGGWELAPRADPTPRSGASSFPGSHPGPRPAAGEASRRGRWGRASAGQAAGCSRGAGLPWSAEAPHWPWQLPCGRWAVPGRRWRDPRVPHLVWGWNSEFRARPRPIVLSCLDWVVPSIALGQCSFYFLLPFPLK